MTTGDRLRGVAAGVATGLVGGLFGVGGGIVLIPLLSGPFALSPHQAHATSLAVIGATALAGIVTYGAEAHVAWRVALVIGIAGALTAPLGARLAARTSAHGLRRAFAVFLALVALRLLWNPPTPGVSLVGDPWATVFFELALGASIGVIAGFLGIGGGIVAVPALTMVMGMTQPMAQGTALAVILITAPSGTIEHSRLGHVAWRWVPMMAIGAAIGTPAAAWLAQRLPNDLLGRAFAVFALLCAISVWLRAARAREAAA